MANVKCEIEGKVNMMRKKISSELLKVGDRFFCIEEDSLFFKTNVKPKDGNYMCCNESGIIKWFPEDLLVFRLNGVHDNLRHLSRDLLSEALKQKSNNE